MAQELQAVLRVYRYHRHLNMSNISDALRAQHARLHTIIVTLYFMRCDVFFRFRINPPVSRYAIGHDVAAGHIIGH